MTLVPASDNMPSLEKIILPSRAMLRSWREQTLPARAAALEMSVELIDRLDADEDPGVHDMALLGVISDAMQPVEDLAYLATAWDAPFKGLAYYVRATTYSDRIPTNFWQGASRWDDDRLDVLAGFAMRNPDTDTVSDFLELTGLAVGLDPEALRVLEKARAVSRARLRAWLEELAIAWSDFAHYFRAFKHGGLALHRADTTFLNDADDTPVSPSIAVWSRRGSGSEVAADANRPGEVVRYASRTGELAIETIRSFLESRLALLESVVINDDGSIAGLQELQHPWSTWLLEADLAADEWAKLGRGPRLRWVTAPRSCCRISGAPGPKTRLGRDDPCRDGCVWLICGASEHSGHRRQPR